MQGLKVSCKIGALCLPVPLGNTAPSGSGHMHCKGSLCAAASLQEGPLQLPIHWCSKQAAFLLLIGLGRKGASWDCPPH